MKKRALILLLIAIPALAAVLFALSWFNLLPKRVYSAGDFGIETLRSTVDYNGNGIDDYTDILFGAREDAKNHPTYDGSYWEDGYPPDDIGVCSDVVWRAFRSAGYCLRAMVDRDIRTRPEAYPLVERPDDNIDFRRVRNLKIFFEAHAVSLTLDIGDIAAWQPGDIVIFGADKHIGIISDKRDRDGHPYVIHNAGQPNREEDYLGKAEVTAHYRFDASRIDGDVLIPWE